MRLLAAVVLAATILVGCALSNAAGPARGCPIKVGLPEVGLGACYAVAISDPARHHPDLAAEAAPAR